MTIDRQMTDEICRADLGAFVHGAFTALHPGQPLTPNWHIDALCVCIQQMVNGSGPGRLVVNLPPRSLKSFVISVAFPAWMLGRDPSCHLICASYGDDLAGKFSRDCRSLLETRWYRRLFPHTKLNPKKAAESEFETVVTALIQLARETLWLGQLDGGGQAVIRDSPDHPAGVRGRVGFCRSFGRSRRRPAALSRKGVISVPGARRQASSSPTMKSATPSEWSRKMAPARFVFSDQSISASM